MTPVNLEILSTMQPAGTQDNIPVSVTFALDPTPGVYADLQIEPGQLLFLTSDTGMTVRINGETITYQQFRFSLVKDNGCDVMSILGVADVEHLAIFNTSNCLADNHQLPFTYSIDSFVNGELQYFTGTPLDTIVKHEGTYTGIVDAMYRLDQMGEIITPPPISDPPQDPPAPTPTPPPPVPVPPPPAPNTGVVVEAPTLTQGTGMFAGADAILIGTLVLAGIILKVRGGL